MNENTKEPVTTQGRPLARPAYEPKVLRATSIGTPVATIVNPVPQRSEVVTAPGGGSEKHDAAGGTGKLIFQDCDGNEIARLEWKNGKILTDGEKTIQCGCDGGTSSL